MPGTLIAMGRLNRPAIMVYGGTIRPGVNPSDGAPLDIVSAFQSFGAYSAGLMSDQERASVGEPLPSPLRTRLGRES